MIEVVIGLIWYKGKFIIAKRTFGDPEALHKWEFPGGKKGQDESDILSLKREIVEELGIDIDVIGYLCEYTMVYEKRSVHLKLYLCVHKCGIVTLNEEHLEFALVDFSEIVNYNLAPADYELYKMIDPNILRRRGYIK